MMSHTVDLFLFIIFLLQNPRCIERQLIMLFGFGLGYKRMYKKVEHSFIKADAIGYLLRYGARFSVDLQIRFNAQLGMKGINVHVNALSIEVKMPQDATSSSVQDTKAFRGLLTPSIKSSMCMSLYIAIERHFFFQLLLNLKTATIDGERSFSTSCFALALHKMTKSLF